MRIWFPDRDLWYREFFEGLGVPIPPMEERIYTAEGKFKGMKTLSVVSTARRVSKSLKEGIAEIGITRNDTIYEEFKLPYKIPLEERERAFEKYLHKRGIVLLERLEYQPKPIVLAVRKETVKSEDRMNAFLEFRERYRNSPARICSEYEWLGREFLRKVGIKAELDWNDERTETMLWRDAIIERVTDNGEALRANKGYILYLVLVSEPMLFATREFCHTHKEIVEDIKERCRRMKNEMKRKNPEYFTLTLPEYDELMRMQEIFERNYL